MSLRVLQVVSDTDVRGAQVFACDLADALSRRGATMRTLALTEGATSLRLDMPALGARRLGAGTLVRLRRALPAADVVVAHGSATLPACAAAGALRSVPFVYRSIGDPLYWVNSPAKRLRVRLLLARAAAVVALWQGSREALTDVLGVPDSKVQVIPNGVPVQRFALPDASARARARRTLGVPPEAPTVVYIGALSPEKDVEAAVRAVGALPGVWLVVLGDGPLRCDLEGLAGRLTPGRVVFRGPATPATALAAADVLCLPSRSEGMPAVLIEAGLSGVAAVATAVGGVSEIVEDGRSGRLVRPGDVQALADGLWEVLGDASELGRRARRRCEARFDIEDIAGTWDQLLTRVAAGEMPKAPGRGLPARA